VASLERRLHALEEIYARSRVRPPGSGPRSRQFVSGVLAAIAHVRRAPIDHPPHGYEIQKLRAREPWALAQYVAALTILRHEDEDESRKLLAEEAKPGDEPVVWSLIDAVVDRLRFSQGREAGF
jgi:hypothetical protein